MDEENTPTKETVVSPHQKKSGRVSLVGLASVVAGGCAIMVGILVAVGRLPVDDGVAASIFSGIFAGINAVIADYSGNSGHSITSSAGYAAITAGYAAMIASDNGYAAVITGSAVAVNGVAAVITGSAAIREKVLGPDHPDTATSLNNLAEFYESQQNLRSLTSDEP